MTHPPTNRLAGHLPTLDGWRGVAVLMVVACHAAGAGHPVWRPFGGAGVSLFFALSGFLICNRLLAEHERAGRISLGGFYIRRAFRILPPALAFLAALAVLGAAAPGELGACLLFARNYYFPGGWYTGHYWSLAVEEHFYLFFPVLLAWAGPRRALPAALGLAAALLGWRVLDLHWAWLFTRTNVVPQYYRTDCRLPDLLLGAVTALLAARAPARLVGAAAAAGAVVLAARLANLPVPWTLQSALLPWLLLWTVLRPDGLPGRALGWAPLAWLGRMSYSVYLWQQLFFLHHTGAPVPLLKPLQEGPWNVLGLLACATASHYLLERPLTRLGRALAERRRAGSAPALRGEEPFLTLVDRRQPLAQPRPDAPVVVRRPARLPQ
jgi:peptidoglycan/LPS O-acetylase OafA/YrhL